MGVFFQILDGGVQKKVAVPTFKEEERVLSVIIHMYVLNVNVYFRPFCPTFAVNLTNIL